jgi:ATP adenylyltransferase
MNSNGRDGRVDGLGRLWAPWRMAYIDQAVAAPRRTARATTRDAIAKRKRRGSADEEECLFCRVAVSRTDRADLVLAREPNAFLMLNRYPYNPGHLMVAVRRHVARFSDLSGGERRDLLALTSLAERALEAEYRPHGINAGVNVGRVAGAGFPGHLHMHLVPRWSGDTNLMTVIAGTRVLPESLAATWSRLRRALRALHPNVRETARRGR